MDMEEARAKSGRMGWEIGEDGKRLYRHPLQWGEPFMREDHQGEMVPCIKWSNGVSEGSRRLDGLRIEWE